MAMENPLELAIIGVDVAIEFCQRERDVADDWRKAASIDIDHCRVIGGAIDRLPLHDVAWPEQAHEVPQVADLLARIVDRHRRDAEHLVAAGAAHRIDAAEAAAM